jgi:hypothetical protein
MEVFYDECFETLEFLDNSYVVYMTSGEGTKGGGFIVTESCRE